jgi:hypothetical protein
MLQHRNPTLLFKRSGVLAREHSPLRLGLLSGSIPGVSYAVQTPPLATFHRYFPSKKRFVPL